ncbi:MAG: beta-ketoacyl-ACP synthase II [Anaerolineae bacterium]
MHNKRVVITGMGVLCPTGNTVQEAWENTAAGRSGIAEIKNWDSHTNGIENHIAGEVKNFDPDVVLGKREARRADRVTQLALVAATQAMQDSGLEVTDENRYEVGCVVGTGIGGISTLVEQTLNFYNKGAKTVSPVMTPLILPDNASGKVSMQFGLRGPNFCIVTACATGNNAIGEAAEIIRRGQAKAMLAGSSEAAVVGVVIAGFNNMTALTRNADAHLASRPFDRDRDGFVIAEAAGMLMLEDLDFALARGAKIYAEVLGYGHTSDAYHVTAPMETGEGAAHAIQLALEDAEITGDDIDYINAHGTSTPLNDKAETVAIKKALGERAYEIPISSTKSVTGHMLGAGGAVEAIFCIEAMRNSFIPPTVNLHNPDPECDLNYTPNIGVQREVNIAMSNSFGFGGHNAVIILGKYHANGKL